MEPKIEHNFSNKYVIVYLFICIFLLLYCIIQEKNKSIVRLTTNVFFFPLIMFTFVFFQVGVQIKYQNNHPCCNESKGGI